MKRFLLKLKTLLKRPRNESKSRGETSKLNPNDGGVMLTPHKLLLLAMLALLPSLAYAQTWTGTPGTSWSVLERVEQGNLFSTVANALSLNKLPELVGERVVPAHTVTRFRREQQVASATAQPETVNATIAVTQPGEIRLVRDGKTLATFITPDDPVAAGETIRFTLDSMRDKIKATDTLVCKGEADFGKLYAFKFPACTYRAEKLGDVSWMHHCKIDPTKDDAGVVTKGLGTPGFIWPEWIKFENFKLSAPCAYSAQDGCVGGYSGETDKYPAYESYAEFVNCDLDCYANADWGFCYTWAPYVKREIVVKKCRVWYCRFGIALASSNKPLQFATIEDTAFIGDARQSKSTGATSGGDQSPTVLDRDVNGGVCAAILCRSGFVTPRNCTFTTTGLEAEYYDTKPGATYQRWGCSRLANWGTDKYSSAPSQTTWVFDKCRSLGITPGISRVWNDVDVRGSKATVTITGDPDAVKAAQQEGAKLVTEANEKALDLYRASRGGSGATGEVLKWEAAK